MEEPLQVPLSTVVSVLEDLLSGTRSKIVQCANGVFDPPKLDTSKLLSPGPSRSRASSVFSPLGESVPPLPTLTVPEPSSSPDDALKKKNAKFAWFDELNNRLSNTLKGFETQVVTQVREGVTSQAFKDKAASSLRQQLFTANQQLDSLKKQLEEKSEKLESFQKNQKSERSAQYAEVVQLKDSLKLVQTKEQEASITTEGMRKRIHMLEEYIGNRKAEFETMETKYAQLREAYQKLKENSEDERDVALSKIADLEAKVRYLNKTLDPKGAHSPELAKSPKELGKPLLEFTRQERAELVKSYEDRIHNIKTDMEAKNSALKRACHSRVAELKKEHEAFMDEVLRNHQIEVQRMEEDFRLSMENEKSLVASAQEELNRERTMLQERMAQVESEVGREREVFKARELMLKTRIDSLEAEIQQASVKVRGLEDQLLRVQSAPAVVSEADSAAGPSPSASFSVPKEDTPRQSSIHSNDEDLDGSVETARSLTKTKSATAEYSPRDSLDTARTRRLDDVLPPKSPLRMALDIALQDVSALRDREREKSIRARSRSVRNGGNEDIAETMVKDFLIEQLEKALEGSQKQVSILRSQLDEAEHQITLLKHKIQTSHGEKPAVLSVFTQTEMMLALSRQNSYRFPTSQLSTLGSSFPLPTAMSPKRSSPIVSITEEDALIESKAAEIRMQEERRNSPAQMDSKDTLLNLRPTDDDDALLGASLLNRSGSKAVMHRKVRSFSNQNENESTFHAVRSESSPFKDIQSPPFSPADSPSPSPGRTANSRQSKALGVEEAPRVQRTAKPSDRPNGPVASPAVTQSLNDPLIFRSMRTPQDNSILARRLPKGDAESDARNSSSDEDEDEDTNHVVADSQSSSGDRSQLMSRSGMLMWADGEDLGTGGDRRRSRTAGNLGIGSLDEESPGTGKKKTKKKRKGKRRTSSALGYPSKLPQEASLEKQYHRPQSVMDRSNAFARSQSPQLELRSMSPLNHRPQSRSFSPLRNLVHTTSPVAERPQGPRAFQMREMQKRMVADVLAQRQVANMGGPISDSFSIVPRDFVSLEGHSVATSPGGKRLRRF